MVRAEIHQLIGDIKALRAELDVTKDPMRRDQLLSELEKTRKQKIQEFKSQAHMTKTELEFIHLFSH